MRSPTRITTAKPHLEGAGVHLHRGFGFGETTPFDPFLLFDDFRNDDPSRYRNGFPWHPHRGIETITYVLAGTVEHADSLGNRGTLGAGDLQWMTAGSGILHQEMPQGDSAGRMHGFQLWANLPAKHKMTAPRYQDIHAADIPTVVDDDGTSVRILSGDFWGRQGPVASIATDPRYLDISLPANMVRTIPIETTRHAFAYVFAGSVRFKDASDPRDVRVEDPMNHGQELTEFAGNRSLVLFDQGDSIRVEAGDEGGRFLLVSGEPLKEPVAWRGPIVMNTQDELRQAWQELGDGTFIKAQPA
ncbi:pirin family protein [Roseimaritima ulvae]|uniref:Quercetin 2,3-dioxygenase n=1 Tax=Roseimaritima ulvae TaxID=980254 RepID=A0A5B9QV63_9BACT|nr:pirin family protein [Roseimaritima ulvae]QEG41690.1 Quercetin 2,3-dioxygenase [Roseimaritima ulvae]